MFLVNILFFTTLHWCFVNCEIPQKPNDLPCNLDDSKCMKSLGQWVHNAASTSFLEKGNDSSTDFMLIELVDAKLATVKYKLEKTKVQGLNSCKVTKNSFNADLSHMRMVLFCPYLHFVGDYDIDGSVLSFPITGNGDFVANPTNYTLTMQADVGLINKENKLYAKLKQFNVSTELLGDADFLLKNLFDGNKQLSDNLHRFGRSNGRAFAKALDNPFFTIMVKKIMKGYNQIYKETPITELLQVNESDLKIGE